MSDQTSLFDTRNPMSYVIASLLAVSVGSPWLHGAVAPAVTADEVRTIVAKEVQTHENTTNAIRKLEEKIAKEETSRLRQDFDKLATKVESLESKIDDLVASDATDRKDRKRHK